MTRRTKLTFGIGEDTPEIDIIMKSAKYRDLRAQLEALDQQPRGTPLRIDVQVDLPEQPPERAGEDGDTIEDEVKAIQNAVYSWARAKKLSARGLAVSAAKKIISECRAVVRVEIAEAAEAADSLDEDDTAAQPA